MSFAAFDRHGGFGDAIKRIGHGANEFDDSFASSGRNGVKFQPALGAEGAQFFEMRAVGGGVELRGHDDHRLFGEHGAERRKLVLDDLEIAHRIAIVRIARVHKMRDQACAFNVLQEASAKPGAFMGALDEARQIGDNERAAGARCRVGIGGDDAEMRLERRERIRSDFRTCRRNARDQRGLTGVRKTNEAHIREQLQFETQVAFLAGMPVFMLARRLVPWSNELRVAVATAAASTTRG